MAIRRRTKAASNDKAAQTGAAAKSGAETPQVRDRSKIEFPYLDLGNAMRVATALHATIGLGSCQPHQLAAALDTTTTSSGFRARVSTARMFGLVETDATGAGGIKLTSLGQLAVDPTREREVKATAFLAVPLYKAVYERYLGRKLPPTPSALQNDMIGMGVASKQADRARQTFDRSASAAGFYERGKDRLVMPVGELTLITNDEQPNIEVKGRGRSTDSAIHVSAGEAGSGEQTHHPFISGLLTTLPDQGQEWPVADRAKWLQTAASIFSLIYKGDGTVKVELER